ncbi:unnamed protein product [Lampetra fluviatilis]
MQKRGKRGNPPVASSEEEEEDIQGIPQATPGAGIPSQGEAETLLAYRGALLALGLAAYPRSDQVALDSLVMEKMLELASEMGVILPVNDEDEQASLLAAGCLQANETLQKQTRVAAWTGKPRSGDGLAGQPTRITREPVEEGPEPKREVTAAVRGWDRQRGETPRQG